VWHHTNYSETAVHYQETHFRPKSTFMPYINNATLNTFSTKVTYDVNKLFTPDKKTQQNYNLSRDEKEALKCLSTNNEIVIKRADKGGAVVVWGRDQYITEAMRQLDNREYYQPLPSNPIEQIKSELEEMLEHAKSEDWISKKEHDFLQCKCPRLFFRGGKSTENLYSSTSTSSC